MSAWRSVIAAIVALGLVAFATSARAACANPSWLPAPPHGFHIADCDGRDWMRRSVALAAGERLLEGRWSAVHYLLDDGARAPNDSALSRAFAQTIKGAGAALEAVDNPETLVVGHKGEGWFIYQTSDGAGDARTGFTLTTIVVGKLEQQVEAKRLDAPWPHDGCADPPWLVRGIAVYRRARCEQKDWITETVDLPDGDKRLEGARLVVNYQIAEGATVMTPLAIQRNFRAALEKIGARVVSAADDEAKAVAVQKTPLGEVWYIERGAGGNSDGTGGFNLTTFVIAPLRAEVAARPLARPPSTEDACADPPWLARGLSSYRRTTCEGRDWDVGILALKGEDRRVEGLTATTNYEVVDPDRAPPAALTARSFRDALTALGAKLLTAADDDTHVVALWRAPFGEVYLIYSGGSGNEDNVGSFSLTTWVPAPLPREVEVREAAGAPAGGCGDPPWLVRQFPAYKRAGCDVSDFAPLTVTLPDGDRTLAGRVMKTEYELADDRHMRTPLAIWRNYVDALKEAGAELVSDPNDLSRAVLHKADGKRETWFLYASGGGNEHGASGYSLMTLVSGGPPPPTCKLEVYGVNFDFDKSTLRPEAEPVLAQVLALFVDDDKFAAEVGGHTDNIGKPAYNLKLSDARAAAVKKWLVGKGVAPARVASHGYGDTEPLVPNTSDANRFKNRRVELKRRNCK